MHVWKEFRSNDSGLAGVLALVVLMIGSAIWLGCDNVSHDSAASSNAPPSDVSADQLREKLDSVLDWTYKNRHLNLQDHAAWQILHGVLTYKQAFEVEEVPGGDRVSAVEHVLGGGFMKGWTIEPGVVLDESTGRRGLRAILESGSKTGQGHADQWLAVLAQCDLQPNQEILVDGHRYEMADFVGQVQWDVPRNVAQEYSWTLIGLTTYLPTDAEWIASDGRQWSIQRLVDIEVGQELATSACGGTHRLIGMTMALNRHLAAGGSVDGVWKRADQVIQQAIEQARHHQNPDGSFSSNYFRRGGPSSDLAKDLGISGHVLEFLTLAMTDDQLAEPWVRRAVAHLCDLFEKTKSVPLECGALYHAAHGLALYRQRVFGERDYSKSSANGGEEKAVAAAKH